MSSVSTKIIIYFFISTKLAREGKCLPFSNTDANHTYLFSPRSLVISKPPRPPERNRSLNIFNGRQLFSRFEVKAFSWRSISSITSCLSDPYAGKSWTNCLTISVNLLIVSIWEDVWIPFWLYIPYNSYFSLWTQFLK